MKRFEKYELWGYTALLAALVELLIADKLPAFRPALPFALVPATVCAGMAAHLHRKLPKDKKCSLFSKSHPAGIFACMLIMNAALFLEPLIKLWRR